MTRTNGRRARVPRTKALTLPPFASPAGLALPEGLEYREWSRLGHALVRVHRGVQWWIGDWLCYGEHRYGEKYAQATAETGLSPDSLKRFQWVASRFQAEDRHPALSFSHHEAVAAMGDLTHRRELLERAEVEQITSRDFRELARRVLTPVQPADDRGSAEPVRRDTPTPESAMPKAVELPADLAHFHVLLDTAYGQMLGAGQKAQRFDSDLLDLCYQRLRELEKLLADRAPKPTEGERAQLRSEAASAAATLALLVAEGRLDFPGTGDVREEDLMPEADRGDLPF